MTAGEPAGIGPDLVLSLAEFSEPCRLAVVADPELLQARAERMASDVTLDRWRGQPHQRGHLAVVPVTAAAPARPGVLDRANARYVLAMLDRAIDGCVQGEFDAMVTGPVHKGIINDAGIPFTGHTEYLAERTGAAQPVMLLTADSLRVALATTHVPLSRVSELITRERLSRVLDVLLDGLAERFAIPAPRVAVCGLNPHAGESGHLGREEIDTIAPVVAAFQQRGQRVSGPFPADTVFTRQQLPLYDAVLAMYHDQGLPVLKHASFGEAVNVTLGLPIVRTSVDHGTALELAGSGHADPGSLFAAMRTALAMIRATHARSR